MSTALEQIRDEYDKRVAETDVPDEGEASDRNGEQENYCDGCSRLALTIRTADLGELCAECRKTVVEPARTPKQIAVSCTEGTTIVAALCEDGSIWTLSTAADVPQWFRLPSIP